MHVQALDIVSVDGQPVGPDNFAARDLVTEIAALDPSVRPDEIGTPWPIQSPGFFSDAGSQGSLHLAFEMPGVNSGVEDAANAGGAPLSSAAPPSGAPLASTPAPSGAPLASTAAPSGAVTPDVSAPVGATPGVASAADAATSPAPSGGGVQPMLESAQPSVPLHDPSYASPKAHAAFEAAKKELGVPYLYGGTSPQTGFDCSGLVQWAYHQAGINLPRVADEQFNVGTPVSLNDLREGDLVFFRIGGGTVDHVGMYVGNHQFIEAPRTGENVQYADLRTPYWAQQFAGARRIVPLDAAGASPGAAAASGAAASTAPAGVTPAGSAGTAGVAPGAAGTASPAGAATPAVAAGAPGTGAVPPGAPGVAAGTPTVPPGTVPAGPPTPSTSQFQALQHQEQASRLHTVKFLQAVQPAPGSPLATPVQPAAIEVSPTGQPVVEQIAAAPSVQPAGGGLVDQLAGQAPAPAGSVISVSSSLLTSGQQTFAAHLASLTGLDPRVVAAWELAEESGGAAQARQAASNFNWLNIGYFDSGTGAIAHATPFSDPVTAAEQTAKFLKGQWGGASTGIRDILHTVGKPPDDQMMAIANSGWASSHYDNGANLKATFEELSNMKIVTAPAAAAATAAPAGLGGPAAPASPAVSGAPVSPAASGAPVSPAAPAGSPGTTPLA